MNNIKRLKMNQNTCFSQFTGLYPVSKTLRFELKPIGKTLEKIKENGIIDHDKNKADNYIEAKKKIDEYHKHFINEALKELKLDWSPLRDAFLDSLTNRSQDSKKKLEKQQEYFRKEIAKKFAEHPHFKDLIASTPNNLFKKILPDYFGMVESIESFKGFSTYFKGFQENRQNIYSAEPISTGVPYRIVHDNFPKFLSNIETYHNIQKFCPSVLADAEVELKKLLKGRKLDEIFDIDFFNSVIVQDGIDFFNQVIGGYTVENNVKIRGVNEFANLYRQQNPEFAKQRIATRMIPLYKQILSDRVTLSFILEPFNDSAQVQSAVKDFFENHILHYYAEGSQINVLDEISDLIIRLNNFDLDKIFIARESLTKISQKLFGSWNSINDAFFEYYEKQFGSAQKAANKKKIEAKLKEDYYSIQEINGIVAQLDSSKCVFDYWKELENLKTSIESGVIYKKYEDFISQKFEPEAKLDKDENIQGLKDFLDSINEFLHYVKPLIINHENGDAAFYNELIPLYDQLSNIIPLYNKTRDFVTQKPSDSSKFKLNFENPTLADGWDQNNETANASIILRKDGNYYLGIMNARTRLKIGKYKLKEGEAHYDKMIYKQIADPTKDIPNLMVVDGKTVSKKGRKSADGVNHQLEEYKNTYLPKEINDIRKKGSYLKTSPNFDIKDSQTYTEYYIQRLIEYKKEEFSFNLRDASEYSSYSEFLDDVAKQKYKISFTPIPDSQINAWIEEGKLFLFQIYNKDFAPGAKGNPNLHTLYWKATFSPENLKDIVFKLNGEAELFYRPSSIRKPYTHRVGEKLVNRMTRDGRPIPDAIFEELFGYFNKLSKTALSEKAKEYLDFVVVKDVKHEITKDKRYTEDKFEFHVPLTINFKADDGSKRLNDQVKDFLKNNSDVNIIGIDRGERNLIYMTLINQKGEILIQKSFNLVDNIDYHEKLSIREQERKVARESWRSIGKIKDLKEGYLSLVIHEIAKTMVENNAIIVLEDLNLGFKRGRFCVEKQVYQKFEKMLIDKLNYLVFKDCMDSECGGVLKGFQLTRKFDSFQELSKLKQSGFLFYVPAAYTSKIDPTTGFANLFNMKNLTSAEKMKSFLLAFDDISYDLKNDAFVFSFDYENKEYKLSQTSFQKKWSAFTVGKRIVYNRGEDKCDVIEPTLIIKEALECKGVKCSDQLDVKSALENIEPSRENAAFFKSICYAFEKTLQMRNSNSNIDYILSPIMNKTGGFFDSRKRDKTLPIDADANGSYHIALKGLYLIENLSKGEKDLKISNEKWFEFVQSRNK